jgi:hypothetical protein
MTVATLFSAITGELLGSYLRCDDPNTTLATTIQISSDKHATTLENAVNFFWFLSLVLSIVAAVNSLVGLLWNDVMWLVILLPLLDSALVDHYFGCSLYPKHRVPSFLFMWLKYSPVASLGTSMICFSIGLVLFGFSSHQVRINSLDLACKPQVLPSAHRHLCVNPCSLFCERCSTCGSYFVVLL